MTLDITAALEAAIGQGDGWGDAEFVEFLEGMSRLLPGSRIDWDSAAGEDWGRLIEGGSSVVILHRRYPIVMVRTARIDLVKDAIATGGVVAIVVTDFNSAELAARMDCIESLAGYDTSRDFDPTAFSVLDLWAASV